MKFFHISDLHIGKQLHGYNLAKDQEFVFSQVIAALKKEQPDALLIAGDVYDKPVPSGEAVKMFDRFLTNVSQSCPQMTIMIIAGNHDSASRIDYAGELLSHHNIHIVGTPPMNEGDFIRKATLNDEFGEIDFYILPFFKPGTVRGLFTEEENESYVNYAKENNISEFQVYFEKLLDREQIDFSRRNVLVTHQFFVPDGEGQIERSESEVITVGTLDNIHCHVLEGFDYVAMGHIHRPQKCEKAIYRYCGTLMPYSVSEGNHEKSITVVTLSKKKEEAVIEMLPVKPLRNAQKLTGTKEELLQKTEYGDDYVMLVVTDDDPGRYVREELAQVYSHILEIRYENRIMKQIMTEVDSQLVSNDYLQIFSQFFKARNGVDMTAEEEQIIVEVLNMAREGSDETN